MTVFSKLNGINVPYGTNKKKKKINEVKEKSDQISTSALSSSSAFPSSSALRTGSSLNTLQNILISDEFICDEYSKIYSISRGSMVTPSNETSTPLPVISLEPKGIIVSQMLCSAEQEQEPRQIFPPAFVENIIEADEASLTSSCFDFTEEIELPWTPEPTPMYKTFGFDLYGNEIEEIAPPRLSYGFAHARESQGNIIDKLMKYRNFKENIRQVNDKTQNFVENVFIKKSCQQINKVDVFNEKHSLRINETSEDYSENIKRYKTNWLRTEGHLVIPRIRRKIDEGSYPNFTVDEKNLSTLLRYTWKGKLLKIRKYLQNKEKHSKVNRQDDKGRTALHYVASWACDKAMKVLLNVPGINLNVKDAHDMTPLFKAVQINSLACVKLLVESGANIKITCRDERDIIDYIIQEYGDERIDILNYLLTDAKTQDKVGGRVMTCLHQACLAKKTIPVEKTIELLIARGANINAVEGNGRTPLMLAIMGDRTDIVYALLRNFADVTIYDDNLKNAVWYAKSNTDCYEKLAGCYGNNRNVRMIRHQPTKSDNDATFESKKPSHAKVTPFRGGESTGTEKTFDKEYITNLFLTSK